MPRTDDDSWDITESVGVTALGVAAARAAETESDHPLIRDPFARVFLDAAGPGMWTMFDPSALPADLADHDPNLAAQVRVLADFFVSRTAFFDDFFRGAAAAGVRQMVILAAGLDSRAWRLPWPEGTRVYELDQPKVLEFKFDTLREQGAEPTAHVFAVPIDLRRDWPAALRQAGFDAQAPTAWSVEGLLRYLPARAQDLLFERIHALSCVNSRIAVNAPGSDYLDPARVARERELMQRFQQVAGRLGQPRMQDLQQLWYAEERTDVGDWLGERGWDVSPATTAELMARYGRRTAGEHDATPPGLFISAQRAR